MIEPKRREAVASNNRGLPLEYKLYGAPEAWEGGN